MKKQNIRVHRKGGSKAVSPQVAKTPEPSPGRAPEPQTVSLILLGGVNGSLQEIAGLDYSAAEFATIQRAAKAEKTSLESFLANVLNAGCERILGESLPPLKGGAR